MLNNMKTIRNKKRLFLDTIYIYTERKRLKTQFKKRQGTPNLKINLKLHHTQVSFIKIKELKNNELKNNE